MEEREARKFRRGSDSPDTRFGRVIRIVSRGRTLITGTLERTRLFYHVIPDDPRIVRNILVGDPKSAGLEKTPTVGDKVAVQIQEWTQRHLNPQGEITQFIGRSHEPATEHAALFVAYGLDHEFTRR
jgi:ribonuclease R